MTRPTPRGDDHQRQRCAEQNDDEHCGHCHTDRLQRIDPQRLTESSTPRESAGTRLVIHRRLVFFLGNWLDHGANVNHRRCDRNPDVDKLRRPGYFEGRESSGYETPAIPG